MTARPHPTRFASVLAAFAIAGIVALACDAEGDDDGMGTDAGTMAESDCDEGEVIVAYVGTDNDRDECSPSPEACDVEDPCFDDECIGALYALCAEDTLGSACAELGGPVTVSCN